MTTDPVTRLAEDVPGLHVDRRPARLADFAVDASGLGGLAPLAVLRPDGLDALRALIQRAPTAGLRLLPVSSKGPHHRGDTRSAERTAILDMSGFDAVVRVDRRNRVALFEAGVDFARLDVAVRAEGLRPLLPLGPRPGKSALAAYLEREPTVYPRLQWDLADPLLCTEVVFGTGEHFRTGASAGPGSLEEQWAAGDAQTNPMGPGQSDLMRVVQGAQGSLGVVTWCSARCQPVPAQERLHLWPAATLAPLVRAAYALSRRGHADVMFLGSGDLPAALLAHDRDGLLEARAGAPAYALVFSVSAPPYAAEHKARYVEAELDALAAEHSIEPAAPPPELLDRITRPRGGPWWKEAGLGGTRELFFLSTLDRAEALIDRARRFLRSRSDAPAEVMIYVQPLIGGRCCHVELIFPAALAQVAALDPVVVALAEELLAAEAFFSRPYGSLTAVGLRGTSQAPLLRRLKSIFDPHGVLSPGVLEVPVDA